MQQAACGTEHGELFHVQAAWLSARSSALVVGFGLLLLLPFLGSSRAVSYHEMIFAQPAREMLAGGDWLQPRVAGVANNHKPPLAHWLIAMAMLVTGSQSEFVVRLPSVAAALFTAWVVAGLAARWLGDRAGLLAGLIQLTTYYLLRFGKLADADMLLCATVCGAIAAFMVAHVDSPHGRGASRWLGVAFYLAAGLSFLVKGPIGSVFVFSACATYLIWTRQWPRSRFFFHPAGLALYGVLVVAWPYAAYRAQPEILDDWWLHHFGRFQGELRGFKHPLYYFYSLPAFMLPWTPLVLTGWRQLRRQPERYRPLLRFLACWLVPGLLIISASAFKRKHYAIPLLPACSVLAAAGLCYLWHAERLWSARRQLVTMLTGSVTALLAVLLAIFWLELPDSVWLMTSASAATAMMAGSMWLRERRAYAPGLAALFAGGWLLFVGVEGIVAPHYDSYHSQRELAQRINALVDQRQPLYLVHIPENQITYYLAGNLVRIDKEKPFVERLVKERSTSAYAIAPAYIVERLRAAGEVETLDECRTLEAHTPPRERLTLVRFSPHDQQHLSVVNPPIDWR